MARVVPIERCHPHKIDFAKTYKPENSKNSFKVGISPNISHFFPILENPDEMDLKNCHQADNSMGRVEQGL
jgi:hypothetical protein